MANRLDEVLDQLPVAPKVFVLRMRQVPMVDASGAYALKQFMDRCRKQGTAVILSGVQDQPHSLLLGQKLGNADNFLGFADDFETALIWSRQALSALG